MCVVMWGKRAPAPIFGLYTCITIGMTVAPLITAPFLSKPTQPNHNETTWIVEYGVNGDGGLVNYVAWAYRMQGRTDAMLFEEGFVNRNETLPFSWESIGVGSQYNTNTYLDNEEHVRHNYDEMKESRDNIMLSSLDAFAFETSIVNESTVFDQTTDLLQHQAPNMTVTHMWVPYAISGISSMVIGFGFLGFYLLTSVDATTVDTTKRKIRDMLNPGSCANGSKWFGLYCTMSLLVCYVFSNGRDRGFGMFVFTVANKGLHVDKNTAALIMFSFNATGAFARALCALLSLFIPIQLITLILVIGGVLVQTIMIFYALESVTYFWILCCILSLFMGPVYPSMMGWVDRYIEVNGVVIAVIQVGIGTGGLSGMFLTNYIFQRFGIKGMLDLALVYGAGLATVFIPLQIIAHIRGTRDKKENYEKLQNEGDEFVNSDRNNEDGILNIQGEFGSTTTVEINDK